jgi:Ca2+/Na+ antiporter
MDIIKNSWILNISMYSHLLFELIFVFYIFIFPKKSKYDFYLVIFVFFVFISKFIFKYECIWSYFDKKIKDNNYVLGSIPDSDPFRKLYIIPNAVLIVGLIMIYTLIKIIIRNTSIVVRFFGITTVIMALFIEAKIKKMI